MYLLVGNSKKQKQKEIVQILHAEVWTQLVLNLCCVNTTTQLVLLCFVLLHCLAGAGRGGGGCFSSDWMKCPLKSTMTVVSVNCADGFGQEKKLCWCLQTKEDGERQVIMHLVFLVFWEKTLGLQVKREACEKSVGSLAENMVGKVTGDAFDFTDEGQESSLASSTLGLQRQPWSSAV